MSFFPQWGTAFKFDQSLVFFLELLFFFFFYLFIYSVANKILLKNFSASVDTSTCAINAKQ